MSDDELRDGIEAHMESWHDYIATSLMMSDPDRWATDPIACFQKAKTQLINICEKVRLASQELGKAGAAEHTLQDLIILTHKSVMLACLIEMGWAEGGGDPFSKDTLICPLRFGKPPVAEVRS